MNDTLLKVKAFHRELSLAVAEIAKKHGLTVASDRLRYDDYQWRTNLVFNVQAKSAELKQIEAKAYSMDDSDPKINETIVHRRIPYVVQGFNRSTNLLVKRAADGRAFIFKRSKLTNKFDYFDQPSVVAANL